MPLIANMKMTAQKKKAKQVSEEKLNNELIAVFRKASIHVGIKLELYELLNLRKKARALEEKLEVLNEQIEKKSGVLRARFKI